MAAQPWEALFGVDLGSSTGQEGGGVVTAQGQWSPTGLGSKLSSTTYQLGSHEQGTTIA